MLNPNQGHDWGLDPIPAVIGRWEEAGLPGEPTTYTGRTCKLYTERPQLGFDPGTLFHIKYMEYVSNY